MLSKLSLYSLGTVVEDKESNSNMVKAIPYEVLTDLDGEVSKFSKSVSGGVEDLSGNVFGGNEKVASIECEWLPFGDLRTTSPDMVLGEQVIIWRYADTEDFYWTPKRQDLLNRKLEHIILTLSNTKDDQDESKPYDKAYTITLSTRDGYLSIVTDDNNKEKAKYEYKMNTKEGIVSLTDNHDNSWTLDSPNRKLTVETSEVLYKCKSFKITGTLDVLGVSTHHSNLIGKADFKLSGSSTVGGTGKYGGSLSSGGSGSFSGTVNAAHFVGSAGSVKYR